MGWDFHGSIHRPTNSGPWFRHLVPSEGYGLVLFPPQLGCIRQNSNERTKNPRPARMSQIQSDSLAPFSTLRFPSLSAVFIIRAETIGGESNIRQHQSPAKNPSAETSNTDRKIGEYGNTSPAKNPPSNFHFCCLSTNPGNNITLSGATSSLPAFPREASSLCLRQYPEVLNSNALQPSNAHFRSPILYYVKLVQ